MPDKQVLMDFGSVREDVAKLQKEVHKNSRLAQEGVDCAKMNSQKLTRQTEQIEEIQESLESIKKVVDTFTILDDLVSAAATRVKLTSYLIGAILGAWLIFREGLQWLGQKWDSISAFVRG